MTYRAGEETHELSEGFFIYLPRGIPHAFRIRGDRPARFLSLVVPGVLLGLYDEVGVPAAELRLPGPGGGSSDGRGDRPVERGRSAVRPPRAGATDPRLRRSLSRRAETRVIAVLPIV